jgi:hypothetical protein
MEDQAACLSGKESCHQLPESIGTEAPVATPLVPRLLGLVLKLRDQTSIPCDNGIRGINPECSLQLDGMGRGWMPLYNASTQAGASVDYRKCARTLRLRTFGAEIPLLDPRD